MNMAEVLWRENVVGLEEFNQRNLWEYGYILHRIIAYCVTQLSLELDALDLVFDLVVHEV